MRRFTPVAVTCIVPIALLVLGCGGVIHGSGSSRGPGGSADPDGEPDYLPLPRTNQTPGGQVPSGGGGSGGGGEGGGEPGRPIVGGTSAEGFPVPPGFTVMGAVSTNFEFWDRYETNYASGGSGPSQRWDNRDMDKLNFVAGFEFKIGPDHGERGNSDSVGLKLPRCDSESGERGDYIPYLEWHADGSNSTGGVGKEIPHPSTSHMPFNVDDPRPQIGDIKDGQWHGFLAVIYNDEAEIPTILLFYNETASGRIDDYVFVGRSKDTGSGDTEISPGNVLPFATEGGCSGAHPLQIRIDEIPRDQLEVRKMFAVEVRPDL